MNDAWAEDPKDVIARERGEAVSSGLPETITMTGPEVRELTRLFLIISQQEALVAALNIGAQRAIREAVRQRGYNVPDSHYYMVNTDDGQFVLHAVPKEE